MPELRFVGRTALVTGAARGIGRASAELLAELGARVIALDQDDEALRHTFDESRFVRLHGDVAGVATGELAAAIWRDHGPIELLVNNVGIATPAHFLDLGEDDFDLVFGTNLRGPWFFTREIARQLVDARLGGSIVFVSSLHDTHVRTLPHYSASKAAAAMLVRELAYELGPHGIRVNAVSPGCIRTSANPMSEPAQEAHVRRTVPLGREGQPEDVARMVAMLLSDDWSGYVNGVNVPVDGGLALHTWAGPAQAAQPDQARRGRLRRLLSP